MNAANAIKPTSPAAATSVAGTSAASIGAHVQAVLVKAMRDNGASVPSEVSSFAADFAPSTNRGGRATGKDAQGIRVLADPEARKGIQAGALLASDSADSAWVSRSVDQSHDVQHWVAVATKTGLIKPMSDKYRMLVEVGVFFLDAMGAGYKSQRKEAPITGSSDQQAAGLAILDVKAGKVDAGEVDTAIPHLTKAKCFANWRQDDVERLAALLASTGTNVGVELFAGSKYAQGAAQVRKLIGAPAKFLNDPAEARAFGDALIVLKLSDRSRGQAKALVESGGDLSKDRLFNGETVIKYRAAQKA